MFCKAKRFEANKGSTCGSPRSLSLSTQQNTQTATNTKKCFICDEIIKELRSGSVVTYSLTTPGNKIVHCDGCYNLLASKTFKSVFAKASSDFYELDTKLNQANEKLIKTNESVAEIEEKICSIQVLLEKFINDINNNSINRSCSDQDGSNSESSVNEIPKAVTDNLQDRIKRKKSSCSI